MPPGDSSSGRGGLGLTAFEDDAVVDVTQLQVHPRALANPEVDAVRRVAGAVAVPHRRRSALLAHLPRQGRHDAEAVLGLVVGDEGLALVDERGTSVLGRDA